MNQASLNLLIISYCDAVVTGGIELGIRYVLVCVIALLVVGVNLLDISFLVAVYCLSLKPFLITVFHTQGKINELLFAMIILPFLVVFFWSFWGVQPGNWGEIVPASQRNLGVFASNMLWNMQVRPHIQPHLCLSVLGSSVFFIIFKVLRFISPSLYIVPSTIF